MLSDVKNGVMDLYKSDSYIEKLHKFGAKNAASSCITVHYLILII